MMVKWFLVITFLCVLLGCATVPIPMSEATQVPESRVINKIPVTSKTPAKLTVIRDVQAGGLPTYVSFFLKVNGIEVAELKSGEKYTLDIDEGEEFLAVRTDGIDSTNRYFQIETTFKPSKHYVYRVGNDANRIPDIERDVILSDK